MQVVADLLKILGLSAPIVSVSATLYGLAIYLGSTYQWDAVRRFDAQQYSWSVAVGLAGACLLITQIGAGLYRLFMAWRAETAAAKTVSQESAKKEQEKLQEQRLRAELSTKNLAAASSQYLEVLQFHWMAKQKRFAAPGNSRILLQMEKAFLLEIDDPNHGYSDRESYFVIPEAVWDRLADRFKGQTRAPKPTWLNTRGSYIA